MAVVRACTLPVAVPLGHDPTGKPWTWQSFNQSINAALRLSTDLANWCVRRLFYLDDPTNPKTPAAVKTWYGYRDASENYPDAAKWAGAMNSFSVVTRTVQRKYIQERFDVMVRHESRLLTYRYPFPFPVHNAVWKTSYADGGFPSVKVNIPSVGAVELRLMRRADFGRQLAMFKQLHDGTAKRGEAALYRDRKGQLLVKLVGTFPVREPDAERSNVCFLHTDPNAFLVAEINGRSPWILNCDHLKRWQAGHRAYRQRSGEDLKREKRLDRRQRAHLNQSRELRCDKHNDRLDTACHQISAQVAQFCERQKVATVAYDESNKEFIPDGFPWHRLKERLRYKLAAMGVGWIDGSFVSLNEEERDEWLLKARALLSAARKVSAHKSRPRRKSHPAVSVVPAT